MSAVALVHVAVPRRLPSGPGDSRPFLAPHPHLASLQGDGAKDAAGEGAALILVDSGFLYALLDRDDAWHRHAVSASGGITEGWITTWPVLSEATHLITRRLGPKPAIALLQEVASGDIAVWEIRAAALMRVPVLLRRHADLPMDLADASLVLLAEALGHGRIVSTDERDFRTYRG